MSPIEYKLKLFDRHEDHKWMGLEAANLVLKGSHDFLLVCFFVFILNLFKRVSISFHVHVQTALTVLPVFRRPVC